MTPEQKAHEAAMIAEYQRERDRHSQTAAACLASEAALDEARRDLARVTAERDEARGKLSDEREVCQETYAAMRVAYDERDTAQEVAARREAEAHRLRAERDAARAEEQATRARWQSSLASLRTGTLERERDAALAREARLREAAERAITMIGWDGGEARRDLEAAIEADDTATTWLADREREARAKALEEAAEALTSHDITSDIGEQLADADEARAWLRDRAARERGER